MPTPTPERILQRLEWKVLRRLDGILQGDYHSDERDAVDCETPGGSEERIGHTCNRRADRRCGMEHRRVQRDRIRQIIPIHQLSYECLPRGRVE